MHSQIMSRDIVVAEWKENKLIVLNEPLLPLYLKRVHDLKSWLETRAIDSHRANSRLLKKALRLAQKDDVSTALQVNAATITDTYWIRPFGSELSYADIRFNNDYFANLALTGNYNYSLHIYDTELIRFSMEEQGLEGLVAKNLTMNSGYEYLMPLDMQCTNEGVIKWLERRVIPKSRAFVDKILKTLGLGANDTKGIIDICKGLSLNHSYWIVPAGFKGKFSQYNFYENRFSEMLALVAYTGVGQSKQALTTSPELTTNGALPKAWRFVEGDGIYLYKGGTSGASNTALEPYCEHYASQIAEAMQLNAVHYDLENWKGIIASKCRLFTNIDISFVPAGRLIRSGGIKACLDYYSKYGKSFRSSFAVCWYSMQSFITRTTISEILVFYGITI